MRRVAAAVLFSACTSSGSTEPNPTGFVNAITQGMVGQQEPYGYGIAGFDAKNVAGPEVQTFGSCDVLSHRQGGDVTDAGPITIVGGTSDITLNLVGEHYQQDTHSGLLFKGDEMLTVQASGGDVPPFVTTVRAPGPITITAPASAGNMFDPEVSLPHGQPLVVQWNGTGGLVQLAIDDPVGSKVICRFRAADGVGTVPPEALAPVDGTYPSFQFDSVGYTTVQAGDWNVEVSATFHASWSSAQLARGHFDFQ